MTGRRPLVAANWKMNGTLASIRPLLEDILAGLPGGGGQAEVAICTPYIYIPELQARLRDGLQGKGYSIDRAEALQNAATGVPLAWALIAAKS